MPGTGAAAMKAAWVMTHYPRNSQTFNHREIVSLMAEGLEIQPIALNLPDPVDVALPERRRASERTFYLKRPPLGRALRALASFVFGHPGAALGSLGDALATTGRDPSVIAKRLLHWLGAVLVVDHCRRHDIRHIHAPFGGTSSTLGLLAAGIGCRLDGAGSFTWSCTIHGPDIENDPPWLLRRKVASAGAMICVSDHTRSQVLRVSDPADWGKVVVVRCGIELERFPRRPAPEGKGPFRILCVGRLAPEKGQLVLLEALQRLEHMGIDASLTLAGGGPLEADIRAFVESNGLEARVDVAGEVPADRIPELLREADAFCLPSFAEGMPISIVEAMAIGVPVVSTQICGIPEMVVDGVTGVCVPAGRADLLAEGLAKLAANPEHAHDLATAARVRVEKLYDVRHTTRELIARIGHASAARG